MVINPTTALRLPSQSARLSTIMRESITAKSEKSYNYIFISLERYCKANGFCALPVSPEALAFWLADICPQRIKSSSCSKYLSAIRNVHISEGYSWTQRSTDIVQRTLTGLQNLYPSIKNLKVALSLPLLIHICSYLPGWPYLRHMSYSSVLFITASALAFYGSLRGGEFFTYPGSNRPILLESCISIQQDNRISFVAINIPFPKAKKGAPFSVRVALAPCLPNSIVLNNHTIRGSHFPLNPVYAWRTYLKFKSKLKLSSPTSSAFLLENKSPLTRQFMISKCVYLFKTAAVSCVDLYGNSIPIRSASWRAGHVVSSLDNNFSEAYIKASGAWSSEAWISYSSLPISSLSRASDTITSSAIISSASPLRGIGWASSAAVFESRDPHSPH